MNYVARDPSSIAISCILTKTTGKNIQFIVLQKG